MYPDLQSHLKEPGKLEQSALDEQLLCLDELHSSTSLNKGKNIYYFYSCGRKGQYFQFISRHAQNKSFCLDISLFFNSFIPSFIKLFLYIPLFINLFVLYSFTQFTIVAKITAWTQTAKPLLAKSCLTSWVAWARITGTKVLKNKKEKKEKEKIR